MSSPSPAIDILLVDDDDDLRGVLGELLEECGYRVVTARDGSEALDYLRDHGRPAVILLDLMMPIMDGASFRQQQQGDPALRDIPVFLLTARGESEEALSQLGASRLFRKPIALAELLKAIAGVVNR